MNWRQANSENTIKLANKYYVPNCVHFLFTIHTCTSVIMSNHVFLATGTRSKRRNGWRQAALDHQNAWQLFFLFKQIAQAVLKSTEGSENFTLKVVELHATRHATWPGVRLCDSIPKLATLWWIQMQQSKWNRLPLQCYTKLLHTSLDASRCDTVVLVKCITL